MCTITQLGTRLGMTLKGARLPNKDHHSDAQQAVPLLVLRNSPRVDESTFVLSGLEVSRYLAGLWEI